MLPPWSRHIRHYNYLQTYTTGDVQKRFVPSVTNFVFHGFHILNKLLFAIIDTSFFKKLIFGKRKAHRGRQNTFTMGCLGCGWTGLYIIFSRARSKNNCTPDTTPVKQAMINTKAMVSRPTMGSKAIPMVGSMLSSLRTTWFCYSFWKYRARKGWALFIKKNHMVILKMPFEWPSSVGKLGYQLGK